MLFMKLQTPNNSRTVSTIHRSAGSDPLQFERTKHAPRVERNSKTWNDSFPMTTHPHNILGEEQYDMQNVSTRGKGDAYGVLAEAGIHPIYFLEKHHHLQHVC